MNEISGKNSYVYVWMYLPCIRPEIFTLSNKEFSAGGSTFTRDTEHSPKYSGAGRPTLRMTFKKAYRVQRRCAMRCDPFRTGQL